MSFSNDLIKYYNGETKLSDQEVHALCDQIIQLKPSNYLIALAHYQKAILLRKRSQNYDAFEAYSSSYSYLEKCDTLDNYLEFNIRRNQGVILNHNGYTKEAAKKHEEALPYAHNYSIKAGLSVKQNWAAILAKVDPEQAMEIFLELLDEAEQAHLEDRKMKVYDEIGKMFTRSGEYEEAKDFFKKGLSISSSKTIRARLLNNLSSTYYYEGAYEKQEQLLRQSLEILEGSQRFDCLRDLGECYIMQNKLDQALDVLLEAEQYYPQRNLVAENIRVFEWLAITSPDSARYWKIFGREFEKMAKEKEKIGALLKQQGMQQMLLRLVSEKEKKTKISFYKMWAIVGAFAALLILLLWRIWWNRFRKGVGKVLGVFEEERTKA